MNEKEFLIELDRMLSEIVENYRDHPVLRSEVLVVLLIVRGRLHDLGRI